MVSAALSLAFAMHRVHTLWMLDSQEQARIPLCRFSFASEHGNGFWWGERMSSLPSFFVYVPVMLGSMRGAFRLTRKLLQATLEEVNEGYVGCQTCRYRHQELNYYA